MAGSNGVYRATPRTLADGEDGNLTLTSDGALRVDISTGDATGTEYTEDAVSTANPVGGMLMSRRRDTLTAAEVTTDGDNIALNSTSKGQLHTFAQLSATYNATLPTYTDTQVGQLQVNSRGVLACGVSGPAGALADTVALGTVTDAWAQWAALYSVSYNLVYNGASYDRMPGNTVGVFTVAKGATTGGLTPFRILTGTTGVIKASAGQLYKLASVRNANAAVRYLHLYDKATAPTLSTDTPVLSISLLASSIQNAIDFGDIGVAFANGISWAYTTDNIAIPASAGTSTELMTSGAYK